MLTDDIELKCKRKITGRESLCLLDILYYMYTLPMDNSKID